MKELRKMSILFALLMVFSLSSYAVNYFVSVAGTGDKSGSSWENAMSNDEFIALFDNSLLTSGDNIYLAEGTYTTVGSGTKSVTKLLYCTVGVNLYGGYPSSMTGTDTQITYPTVTETVFSGDINNNGTSTSANSANFLYFFTADATVEIKGISFTRCFHQYPTNTLTNYNSGNTQSAANSYGALVLESTNATVQWCKFYDNATPVPTTSSDGANYYGGAANVQNVGLVHFVDCSFTDNFAARLGAAIGVKSPSTDVTSTVIIERCLFDRNNLGYTQSGKYGGAVALNGARTNCYIINSTFARSQYYANGGALSSGNATAVFSIISSTFAENDDFGYTSGSYGKNFRGASSAPYRMANSICVGNETTARGVTSVNGSAEIYNEGTVNSSWFTSGGYNIIGRFGTSSFGDAAIASFQTGDLSGVYYEDVFGKTYNITDISSTSLADRGGFTKTMAPTKNYVGITLNGLSALKTAWNIPDNIWNVINLTVDQRGYDRQSQTYIGAYDKGFTSEMNEVSTSRVAVCSDPVNNKLSIVNVPDDAIVAIFNLMGTKILSSQKVTDGLFEVNTKMLPAGCYIVSVDGQSTKKVMVK